MTTPIEIVVYGKPACPQCLTTKLHLGKLGLPYQYLDVTEDQAAHDAVAMLGFQSLPVVVVGDMHWTLYRHEKLQRLAEIYRGAPDVAGLESVAEQYLADGDAA